LFNRLLLTILTKKQSLSKRYNSYQVPLRINFIILASLCQLECFDKFVGRDHLVGFLRPLPAGNILNAFTHKGERLGIGSQRFQDILGHKTLNVELTKLEGLSSFIVADEPPIFMHLPLQVLFLRWVGGLIPDVQIRVMSHKLIRTLILTSAWLPRTCSTPVASE
jgi:hypothetical protein